MKIVKNWFIWIPALPAIRMTLRGHDQAIGYRRYEDGLDKVFYPFRHWWGYWLDRVSFV